MAGIVLKISIMDTHPPVWRRVVVPENISFLDLHRVIQIIFGWEDAHLHLFEAPRRLYAIVSDEEDAMEEAYLLEHRTQLRPVFEREKWMKYTYDFGDDWRHKILFEKRLPDEKTDVARVLKAKGNNFAEDSGGVWGQQPQQEVYDVEQVNQRLETMHLKNIRMSAADKQKLADIYLRKEWWKNLDKQLEQLLGESEQWEEPLSPIEKESEEWDCFCGEHLTGKVCVKMGNSSSRELLGRLGAQKAKVYCKYLQLSSDGWSTEQMLDAVAEELEIHPEYNLYLLEKEDVAELKRLVAAAPDEILTMSSDAVQKGLMLGLLKLQIPEGTEAAYIFPAVDLPEKLTEFQSFACKRCVRELSDIAEKMEKLLAVYIVIELDAFYELFEKQWGMGLSKRDFLRYVYWYGVMGQNFETYFSEFTDICYVGIADLDIEQIHRAREVFAKDLPYKEFDRNLFFADFDEIAVYQEIWTDLASVLCNIFELDETALEDIMEIFFQTVLSGDSIYDVYEILTMFSMHMERELLAIDHVYLWQIFLHLMLETPLPMLNGYSRLEYEQVTGEAAFATGIFQTDEEEELTPETSLFALAPEWQAALAHAYLSNTGAAEIKAIEAVRKKLPAENYEMDAFLACECLDVGKQQKGLSILARLEEQTSDESIEAFLNVWEEYMMDDHAGRGWQEELETEMPYRRETAKVGRNDPCPCGSGKKYKRCCGRK